MVNNEYPYSIFYITHSVFESAGKKFIENKNNVAFSFLFQAVLFNVRYKKHIATQITFTTRQIFELVKDVEWGKSFKGIMELGENMAHAEEKENLRGDKNFRLLQCANDKNTEIIGDVKVICEDYPTRQYFIKAKHEDDYPIEVIDSEEAYEELIEIEKKLKEKLGF